MADLGLSRILGVERAYAARLYTDLPGAFVRQVLLAREPERRARFWNRWGFAAAPRAVADGPLVWIDVLSGGEVMQIHSFVRHLRDLLPRARLVVSSNNQYSCDVARTIPGLDGVLDTPWDLRHVVRRALRRLRPSVLVCVENLPWPVLVREAQALGVRTALCSGFMSKGFEGHETLWRSMPLGGYRCLDFVGAKTREDAEGFARIGVEPARIRVVGNMRFDVEFHRLGAEEQAGWRRRLRVSDGQRIIVAGSVRAGEEAMVLEAFARVRRERSDVVLFLAPSFFSPELDIEGTAARLGLTTRRRSQLDGRPRLDADVLVIDTFGELSRLYSVADLVFIGGSIRPASRLGYGNNIVEPLIHRRPILFGPFMNRWAEITQSLRSVYPGLEVHDAGELAREVLSLLSQPEAVAAIARQADAIIAEHADAPRRNAEFVRDVVTAPRGPATPGARKGQP